MSDAALTFSLARMEHALEKRSPRAVRDFLAEYVPELAEMQAAVALAALYTVREQPRARSFLESIPGALA